MRYMLLYFVFTAQALCEELTLPDPLNNPAKDIKIQERNEQTGLMDEPWYSSDDRHILSFYGGGNANLKKVSRIAQLESSYSFKMDSVWPSVIFAHTAGKFSAFTTPNPAITPTFGEALLEADETLTTVGAGFSYHTRILTNLLGEKCFEQTSFYVSYNIFTESFRNETFSGLGIKTNYGIYWRTSKRLHFGFKFSYDLMVLRKQAEFQNQRGSERSLTLSWPSVGLEIGMYL